MDASLEIPSTPLQYESYSKEFQNISVQENFDGFRVEAGRGVNKYLQASHSLFLGTQMKDSGYLYQFGPTFAVDDGSLLLMARAGLDGVVNGRVIKRLSKNFEFKANFNSCVSDEQKNMYEFSFDNIGTDWASSLKLAWQGAWLVNGTFSQVITPKLQMGGEMTWITTNGASIGAIGARYTLGKNIFTGQISRQPDFKSPIPPNSHSVKMQFVRKVTDRFSMAAEYEYTHPDVDSGMKMGWEYMFRHARVQGLIDSGGKVSVAASDFSGFGISGVIDYIKSEYKFGFMMHIVPEPAAQQMSSESNSTPSNTPTVDLAPTPQKA